MKKFLVILVSGLFFLGTIGMANANSITLTPSDYIYDEKRPRGVFGDAAPGFGTGSWQGPETGKSNMHLWWDNQLVDLFGSNHQLTVGDIGSISFYTKSAPNINENWWLTIYTKRQNDGFDVGSWYDHRVHGFGGDSTGNWLENSTATNLLFSYFPSTGSHTFANINNLLSLDEEILSITFQSDSGWNGFDGQLDGVTITLTSARNGAVGSVNFEPIPEPATMLLFGVGLLGIAGVSRRRKA